MSKTREIANKLIDGMSDVTITSPANGQALVWNGTAWVNANKQDTLVSGTSIKTVNGASLLGSGDIVISGGITDTGHSFTDNGYQKLSNGLILQWGKKTAMVNNTSYAITFPIAFPTGCLNVIGNSGTATLSSVKSVQCSSLTTTGFNILQVGTTASNIDSYWFAIGY